MAAPASVVAEVNDGRQVTQVEMDDPPGYFRVRRTGRVHLVRRVTRVTWRTGEAHQTVEFWCGNMASDQRGALLTTMPPDAVECAGCARIRCGKLPRVSP